MAVLSTLQDYGWAGAGWHNSVLTGGQREVQTPHMDKLVATGIELNQHYTFKFCSPTRSSLQSGRNPIHVNVQNVGPDRHNPDDPVAGFSAIARNMTGMAVHMQAAGWRTAAVGKWDAGMATADHTPLGRGYQQSLIYFHHANDYWQYTCGSCAADGSVVEQEVGLTAQERQELDLPPLPAAASLSPTASCPSKFTILPETGVCKRPGSDLWHGPVADQDECCARCSAEPACVGWTHQCLLRAIIFCPNENSNVLIGIYMEYLYVEFGCKYLCVFLIPYTKYLCVFLHMYCPEQVPRP